MSNKINKTPLAHPEALTPYIISYYYKFGLSTNNPELIEDLNIKKFIAYVMKTGLYALEDNDNDYSTKDLKTIGNVDLANRLLQVQIHIESLEFPIVGKDKPIVPLVGGAHKEYITAGGTYEPHNTHRAVTKMRDNKDGLLHYKWNWVEESEDSSTYVCGVVYSDMVKISEEEYDACMESNMPSFNLLGILQDRKRKEHLEKKNDARSKKEAKEVEDHSPFSRFEVGQKRKRSIMGTVSSLLSLTDTNKSPVSATRDIIPP